MGAQSTPGAKKREAGTTSLVLRYWFMMTLRFYEPDYPNISPGSETPTYAPAWDQIPRGARACAGYGISASEARFEIAHRHRAQ